MTKNKGFLEYEREDPAKRPVEKRLKDFDEFELPLPPEKLRDQAFRCMDCGIPFCHSYGCPLHNRIPEWIELAYLGRWREALDLLHATDNFPEITGRICPAPCESSCTLTINQPAVTIRHIELQIIERGFREGWVVPEPPSYLSGKKVAIIGSGPAGLAAAQQLIRRGHRVTVYEKADKIGGLLRYGIPDFKLNKEILNRRIDQMVAEGVIFEANVDVGTDLSAKFLQRGFDAIVLSTGAEAPRDLNVARRELPGVYFALQYLVRQNRRVAGVSVPEPVISAQGKHVVVIGGGDTGSDCIGNANRQGAASVTQLEILPEPPAQRSEDDPWPTWPNVKRTSSSQEEGCERMWGVATKEFIEKDGAVAGIRCAKVEWETSAETGKPTFHEISGSVFELKADLVLLAMGFLHCSHGPIVRNMNLELDDAGNIKINESMMTSKPGVFATGDSVSGASLIVRAIHSGREVAESVDLYLLDQ